MVGLKGLRAWAQEADLGCVELGLELVVLGHPDHLGLIGDLKGLRAWAHRP